MTTPTVCSICGDPVFNGATAHPCCTRWAREAPGEPCPSCRESRAVRRHREFLRSGRREWAA